ncbi:MAG: NAD(P)/FAD-dependent oxidoreductase [Candidatus Marsarchaeota archaeon]|nr:NAD(P)/FAD-dependent oxidoreductase [Candidatus Marsarchaeota archaeon]MCL5105873.1 NAD(P)/FAD-dependent oxidoreductase [Candidatus Marsarchaeota archaeon]
MKKVIVVGAGIAGMSFASRLCGHGITCEIYESRRNASENADRASGILSKKGLERSGIKYKSSIENNLIGGIVHAGGNELRLRKNRTVAYIIDRKKLARGMYTELNAGKCAKFKFRKRLSRAELLELGRDENNIIIGADGAVSGVASAFGFPKIKEYILTYKAVYSKIKIKNAHYVHLFFNSGAAPGFFGWAAPYSKSRMEIGIGIDSRKKTNSRQAFRKFSETPIIKAMLKGSKLESEHASIIPISVRKQTAAGNVLLVGDAAGQVKATTGGGIIFGSLCAKIAADVVYENIRNNVSLWEYERRWRKACLKDLKMHGMIHKFYSGLTDRQFGFLLRAANAIEIDSLLSKYGDMDSWLRTIKNIALRKEQ